MPDAMEARPTIHVIDDDASVRIAMTRLLSYAGYAARGYASATEFLLEKDDGSPACLVLDIGLPDVSGMDLQAALARRGDCPPIVFITGRGDIATSVRAMKAGAVDFLAKPIDRKALLGAVRTALAEHEARSASQARRARIDGLTERQREVFSQVVKGRLNKQIAAELGLSIRTVKAHRASMMRKLEVSSLAELVRLADEAAGMHRTR